MLKESELITEKELLGIMIQHPDLIFEISQEISAIDFYIFSHELVFTALLEMSADNQEITYLTLYNKLNKKIEVSYLLELGKTFIVSSFWKTLTKDIKKNAIRRNLLNVLTDIKQKYENNEITEQEIENEIGQVVNPLKTQLRWETAKEVMEKLKENLEKPYWGLPTGFSSLDKKIGGFFPGDLICLAGRTSVGKTALMLNFLNRQLKDNKVSLLFSCEMLATDILGRIISIITDIDNFHFRIGLTEREKEELNNLTDVMDFLPLLFSKERDILQIKMIARTLHKKYNLSFLAIDYLQLLLGDQIIQNRSQYIGYIMRELKDLAIELQIPILILSQFSRDVEKEERLPRLSDLRDSGEIEQTADVVLLTCEELEHRSKKEKAEESLQKKEENALHRFLIIAKSRYGSSQQFLKLRFEGAKMKFYEEVKNKEI